MKATKHPRRSFTKVPRRTYQVTHSPFWLYTVNRRDYKESIVPGGVNHAFALLRRKGYRAALKLPARYTFLRNENGKFARIFEHRPPGLDLQASGVQWDGLTAEVDRVGAVPINIVVAEVVDNPNRSLCVCQSLTQGGLLHAGTPMAEKRIVASGVSHV